MCRLFELLLYLILSFFEGVYLSFAGSTNLRESQLAVSTGMRRGELAGLKWQDVDLERGELHVRRSLVRVPTKMGSGYMEAEPKTEKSRRSILFPDFALEALKTHQERQQEIKRQAGSLWQEHDYVFCTPLGEHIHPGHDILEEFKKLLKRAGLPDVRFHDVRRFGDCKIALKGRKVRAITF
ncbi:MAG TPA: site-specific integrase [Ktedonobacteraceae bacterium]